MTFQVGDSLSDVIKGPVTKMDLVKYSGASGDFNPIHTIDEFAKDAGLGGVIAHGMLTMAYVGQMVTDFAGTDADLVDFGVRFRAMVRPGDQITCKGQVTKVELIEGCQYVYLQLVAQNQAEQVVVKGTAKLRYCHT